MNWVEGWLDYHASEGREIEVLFVYYDELKREPARYLRRITDFHELDDVQFSTIITPEPGKLHFRKGVHEQWREEFSPLNQRLVDDLMQDRILRGFDAAASRHPGTIAAESMLASGCAKDAAAAALRAVTEFPNYREGYEALMRAAEDCGADSMPLRALVAAELGKPSVADSFIYRFELVDACRELVGRLTS